MAEDKSSRDLLLSSPKTFMGIPRNKCFTKTFHINLFLINNIDEKQLSIELHYIYAFKLD